MQNIYHHLTHTLRSHIYAYKTMGQTQIEIAAFVKCSQSTVSRELRRNTLEDGYNDDTAHKKSTLRRSLTSSGNARKIDCALWITIQEQLLEQHSPEQIAGRLRRSAKQVSPQTIYSFIRRDRASGGKLYTHLRQKGKKRYKRSSATAGRGVIPERVGIENRPACVEDKSRIGDWEGDTMVGAHHKGVLITYVDRHSKFTIILQAERRKKAAITEATTQAFIELQRYVKNKCVETITYDNGKEFAGHKDIAQALKAQCFFANPYRSCERGLNEHTNGLIRQYFPKGTDFRYISKKELAEIADLLNNRPRKILGYLTPKEVFMAAAGIIEEPG
jgi:IS30 family transposase